MWIPDGCRVCNRRRDVLVIVRCTPPNRTWAQRWRYYADARCFDGVACRERALKRRDRARTRAGVIVLEEPRAPGAPRGWCRWCGSDLRRGDGRRDRRRNYCYEDREGRDCVAAWNRSRAWDARDAIRWRDRKLHGELRCADCDVLCEPADGMSGEGATPWEADHEIPLEDGGAHVLANLRCRCCPCHRKKTAAENIARAARRAASGDEAAIPLFVPDP